MKHSSILLALPIACLMACSSNDTIDEIIDEPAGKEEPILIEVSEAPLTDPETGNQSMVHAKRAPITTKESLSAFYMNGYWSRQGKLNPSYVTRTDNNSQWEANNTWPSGISDDTDIHFYAFANVDNNPTPFYYGDYSNGYSPYLYFMVDQYSEDQKDLLVAVQTAKPKDKTVYFYFTHPCAALQFAICKTKALTNFEIMVEKIILHNIYSCGYYFFDTKDWEVDNDYESLSDFTIFAYNNNTISRLTIQPEVSSTDRTNSAILGKDDSDYLFFIPQTIQAWSSGKFSESDGAYIEIVCSILKNGKDYADHGSVYIPFAAELKKGYIHRYNIRMGTSLMNADGNIINFRD